MNWLKKNMVLVVGGVVVLALLGLAGFFLFKKQGADAAVSGRLTQEIGEWNRLVNRKPSANEENIEAAIKETARLKEVLNRTKQHFAPTATFTNITAPEFKSLLENTLFDLGQMARDKGVTLPGDDYGFSFKSLRSLVRYDQEGLIPLSYQLAEVRAMCEILFEARIHTLHSIKRAKVSTNDLGPQNFISGKSVVTNAVTRSVISPYQVTFYGFTEEIAAVLLGFQAASNCFVVKNVEVQKANAPAAAEPAGGMPRGVPDAYTSRYGVEPGGFGGEQSKVASRYGNQGGSSAARQMQNRYGINPGGSSASSAYQNRYGNPAANRLQNNRYAPGASPGNAATAARATSYKPETVLEGNLLSVTVYLEAIRNSPDPGQ